MLDRCLRAVSRFYEKETQEGGNVETTKSPWESFRLKKKRKVKARWGWESFFIISRLGGMGVFSLAFSTGTVIPSTMTANTRATLRRTKGFCFAHPSRGDAASRILIVDAGARILAQQRLLLFIVVCFSYALQVISPSSYCNSLQTRYIITIMEPETTSTTEEARKVKKVNTNKTNKRPLPPNSSGNNTGNNNNPNATKRAKLPKAVRRTDAAQQAVNDQMRRALEEDKYSAQGSIVDYSDSDSEDEQFQYFGQAIRLDRSALQHAARKYLGQPKLLREKEDDEDDEDEEEEERDHDEGDDAGARKQGQDNNAENTKKKIRRAQAVATSVVTASAPTTKKGKKDQDPLFENTEDPDLVRDGGSIFGQTTGSSNATWVECDKCKKWRRLRGVVDEKKLPSKWYCSMNKNDPERSRCSAPEEEYETPHTPESAADARTRRHFRVWVRRLQTNEAYEARQPLATRQKKRTLTSKDAYEWIRCCNQKCGKWRALLKSMDAKQYEGEWFCVMNTWDEKMASCAAPQENLPALGCPSWVIQDKA